MLQLNVCIDSKLFIFFIRGSKDKFATMVLTSRSISVIFAYNSSSDTTERKYEVAS